MRRLNNTSKRKEDSAKYPRRVKQFRKKICCSAIKCAAVADEVVEQEEGE